MWQIWLIFAGVFLVGEIFTTGFLIFWLSIGSLLAMVVSLFTSNVIVQTAVFVISSSLLVFATKPFANKFAQKDKVLTNVYTLAGKKAIVIKEIKPTDGKGQVKVNGEVWSAICDENIVIPEGSEVEIIKVEGVKAFVSPIKIVSNQS